MFHYSVQHSDSIKGTVIHYTNLSKFSTIIHIDIRKLVNNITTSFIFGFISPTNIHVLDLLMTHTANFVICNYISITVSHIKQKVAIQAYQLKF